MVMQHPDAQQRPTEGRASGARYNRIVDVVVARYGYWVDYFERLLIEDGYPPFREPVTPRKQYDKLVAWRTAGDPRFWKDPAAQEALAVLSREFGAPPPLTPYPAPRQV